jgi:hypothetical protein
MAKALSELVESVQHSLGIGLCKSCCKRICNIRMY